MIWNMLKRNIEFGVRKTDKIYKLKYINNYILKLNYKMLLYNNRLTSYERIDLIRDYLNNLNYKSKNDEKEGYLYLNNDIRIDKTGYIDVRNYKTGKFHGKPVIKDDGSIYLNNDIRIDKTGYIDVRNYKTGKFHGKPVIKEMN